jgi:hypothetical protein
MKDILSKLTQLSEKTPAIVLKTGKQVLKENTTKNPVKVAESKPTLKNIFNSMVNENQNYTAVNIANNQSQILDQDKNIVATVATNKANQTMQDLKTGAMQVPQQAAKPGQPVQPAQPNQQPNQQQMQENEDGMVKDKRVTEKAKNPYAIGMSQAMKKTGDKPPLKKSTITKAHEIAKKVEKTDEGKKAKPDFLDLDKDGNKKESMKKAAADKQKVSTMKKTNEAKAKPDFLDLDKDGNKKESMKKAQIDAKKKKTVKEGKMKELDMDLKDKTMSDVEFKKKYEKTKAEMRKDFAKKKVTNEGKMKELDMDLKDKTMSDVEFKKKYEKTKAEMRKDLKSPTKQVNESMNKNAEAARLQGKADALAKVNFNSSKYDDGGEEIASYLEGYKEGLDDCYGSGSMGDSGMSQMPDINQDMSGDFNDFEEDSLIGGTTFDAAGSEDFGYDEDEMDMAFEAWDKQLNSLLNETATSKFQVRYLPNTSDKYKIEKGFTSKKEAQDWIKGENLRDRAEDISIETSKEVSEGVTVAINKDIENAPDSVTVTAQGDEADQLMAMIKQAGLGLFGGSDEQTGSYGAPMAPDANTPPAGDVGDHDSMMALLQRMTTEPSQDYEDEESGDDEYVHGHPAAACGDEPEPEMVMDEEESEDEMEFEVAEQADSDEAETTADEDAEAEEDQALAGADSDDEEEIDEGHFKKTLHQKAEKMERDDFIEYAASEKGMDRKEAADFWDNCCGTDDQLNEWANDANNERTEDDSYYEDIDFMTKVISGGLNNQKKDQTTLPHTKVTVDDLSDWKKLSGLK